MDRDIEESFHFVYENGDLETLTFKRQEAGEIVLATPETLAMRRFDLEASRKDNPAMYYTDTDGNFMDGDLEFRANLS